MQGQDSLLGWNTLGVRRRTQESSVMMGTPRQALELAVAGVVSLEFVDSGSMASES